MNNDTTIVLLEPAIQRTLSTILMKTLSSFLTPTILVFFIMQLWKYYIFSTADKSCKLPLPPGTIGLPVIGETLSLLFGAEEFYKKRRTEYGKVYKTHLLGHPTIRVIGPENVRKILMGENTLVTTRWPTSTRLLLGEGALSHSVGYVHRNRRKLIAKAFNHNAMEIYFQPMLKVITRHVTRWCEDGFVLAYPEAKLLTFSLAARVLLGFKFSRKQVGDLLEVFSDLVNNLFSLPYDIPGTGFHKGMKARQKLLETIEQQIMSRMSSCEEDDGYDDALSILVNSTDDDGGKMSITELKEACLELLFAGHETTSSAACTMMFQLAKNSQVVEKIKEELDNHGIEDVEGLHFDSIHRLTYVNHVLKEVLRLAPPVGAGFRQAIKTFEMNGMQIPKGWSVAYSIRDTQQTSSIFENVTDFDPDRWLNSDSGSARFDYIPFGGGSRACVGREYARLLLKIMMITLVRNSYWTLKNDKPKMRYIPVPHPVDGLPVEFAERKSSFRPRAHTL